MLFTLPPCPYDRLLVTLLLVSFITITAAFCPPLKCHCDDSVLLADCTGGSLDLVPITLNPQLRELHLAANQIKSVKETLSFYSNLLLLDLSDNQLQTLGERNFNQLRTLRILKVGNNRIAQLSNQTFAGLINLQQLYLQRNELRTVHGDVFRQLNRLRLLDLSHNALAALQADAFVNLITLELLNLSHNRFDNKLSTLTFDRLSSLKVLHLDHNSVQQLPDFLFRSLTQLHTLTLNHCELRNLNRNVFFGLENLRHLKLSHNQFNQLPLDVFVPLENLENLELQGTALLQLPNVFTPLKTIRHLSLGYDRFLKQLTSDLFNQNAKLQSIAIEYCPSLEQLPIGLFNAQRQLVLINLGQNALTTVQPNVFSNYSIIQRLWLTGNPLHCDCNLSWLYASHYLRTDQLTSSDLIKKLSISIEDAEELVRTVERWSGAIKPEASVDLNEHHDTTRTQDRKSKHHSHHKANSNFKQHHIRPSTGHLNEIDYNSAEYQHPNDHLDSNHHEQSSLDHLSGQLDYLQKDQPERFDEIADDQHTHHHHQPQTTGGQTATCFEPLSFVGRPLIELTSAELNCNNHHIDHQSIMINGEKINFENRSPAMAIGYDEQYPLNGNNKDHFNADDFLTTTSSGLNSFTLCFLTVFIVCLVLFVILFSYIYLKRHRKEPQPISSWILKPGGGSSNNATLSFQPFASFDMNQEHLSQPKCNTLVNPLAKLGPLPKKPTSSPLINQNNLLIANSLNSSPVNVNNSSYNSTLSSKIKLTPQLTRIANLTNSTKDSPEMANSKLYEQIDYTGFEEQIYEDPLVDELNDLNMTNNYGYQQLNSTTSTASSYLSNGLNAPTTYEEFLATALMRSTPNSYGTLNGQANRLLNTNNLNNFNNMNFNRTNSNSRRTLNTMVHL